MLVVVVVVRVVFVPRRALLAPLLRPMMAVVAMLVVVVVLVVLRGWVVGAEGRYRLRFCGDGDARGPAQAGDGRGEGKAEEGRLASQQAHCAERQPAHRGAGAGWEGGCRQVGKHTGQCGSQPLIHTHGPGLAHPGSSSIQPA